MRYLLDTHVLIWHLGRPERLSETARRTLADESSELYVSVASLWEATIKAALGKLTIDRPVASFLDGAMGEAGIELLQIEVSHLVALDLLPQLHRDPFDRLIIAQAIADNLCLVTADPKLQAYEARVLWAAD